MEDTLKLIDETEKPVIEMGIKLLDSTGRTKKKLVKLINFDVIKSHQEYYKTLSEEDQKSVRKYQSHNFPIKSIFSVTYLNFNDVKTLSDLLNSYDTAGITKFTKAKKK